MGTGWLCVPLPSRSRSGCVLVSRQPDQRRRPGLQQRGQLHVTTVPRLTRWLTAASPSEPITAQSTQRAKLLTFTLQADVRSAHRIWGWLGKSNRLEFKKNTHWQNFMFLNFWWYLQSLMKYFVLFFCLSRYYLLSSYLKETSWELTYSE